MRSLTPVLVAVALLLQGEGTRGLAQTPASSAAPRDPRRTPAVEVFEQWKDSVVYISGPAVAADGPATAEFFHVDPRSKQQTVTMGSGFIVHASGYIVTNAHATEKIISSEVILSDGTKHPADLVGVARHQDLALLKIQAGRPLQAVRLGRSDDFLIGETVIVISNPHGLRQTCTVGVISAAGRATRPSGLPGITLHGLIQTDASINPGSSGGPWFNVLGQVIAVTTTRKEDSENIAFAVPAAAVRQVLPEMLDVERQYGLATGLEMQAQEPCRVTAVVPGLPAASAGFRPGDVVTTVDGRSVAGRSDFHLALIGRKPGEILKLQVLRGAAGSQGTTTIAMTLTLAARSKPDGAALLKARFGMTAVPLDAARAKAAGLRVQRGVLITEIARGLYDNLKDPPLPGDILARINSFRPRDLDHVGLLLDRVKSGEAVRMVLLRRRENVVTRIDLTVTGR